MSLTSKESKVVQNQKLSIYVLLEQIGESYLLFLISFCKKSFRDMTKLLVMTTSLDLNVHGVYRCTD